MKKISIPFSLSSTQLRSLNKVPELVEGPKCRSAVTKSRAFLAALSPVLSLSSLVLFSACGESTTTEKIVEVATGGTEIVSSVKDLPKCTKDNQGEQALVKGETSVRVCVDGKWFATVSKSEKDTVFVAGDTVYLDNGNYSCTTKQLKDKSGLKIICNGDSIGVVLNGAAGKDGANGNDGKQGIQGEKGDDGIGCTIAAQTDSLVTIMCGGKSMTLNLRANGVSVDTASVDTLELDSEKVAISLDSLAGYSQKGPFLKGSTVYLYELSDGRTLKQTNGNFTSEIKNDDGRYKFTSRNLVSQYALLVADGKYHNEVTGRPTNTAIKLQAYTNMLSRKSANVNLLTHLEKDRVFYLVTQEKKTVRAAKKQAQAEILEAFHIDASKFKMESEDLDVFGKTDADAALLAISILLQRDSSETELSVLLTDMADDLAEDGSWDNAAKKVEIADWAATMDSSVSTSSSKLALFRGNVSGWGLGGGNVPDFEKFIRKFWSEELGLGICGSDSVPVGLVKQVPNEKSKKYYAKNYTDVNSEGGNVRFICDDASLSRWRAAMDIEKDTLGWAKKFKSAKEGAFHNGKVNTGKTYVYEQGYWRYGTNLDSLIGKGCVSWREDTVAQGSNGGWYKCVNHAWRVALEIEKDTATWGHDFKTGDYRNGQINKAKTYVYEQGNWRLGTELDSLIGKGCVSWREDTVAQGSNGGWYKCVNHAWRVALEIEKDTATWGHDFKTGDYRNGQINKAKTYVYEQGNWRLGTELDSLIGFGCTETIEDSLLISEKDIGAYAYKCSNKKWAPECGDLWCGAAKDYFVNTGIADNSGSYGYWADFAWSESGTKLDSVVRYPKEKDDSSVQDALKPIIDTCGGICGEMVFDSNSTYAGVYFTLTEDGETPKDISSWEGLCIIYQSVRNAVFQIEWFDDKNTIHVSEASLPASTDKKIVDFVWSNFRSSGEKAASRAAYIDFMIYGNGKVTVPFAIYSIGRHGTCQ